MRFCFVRRCLDACRCRVPGFGAFLLGEVRGGDPGNITGGFSALARLGCETVTVIAFFFFSFAGWDEWMGACDV